MVTRKKDPPPEPEPAFLEGMDDREQDPRQDPEYGRSNYFMPIDEGIPAVTYYMLKANLGVPIPDRLISQKKQGKPGKQYSIDYVNVTDLKDLLDERVAVWTSTVKSTQQIGDELCVVVDVAIHASDGVFHADGTGREWINHQGFGDTFSNAYAQGFRRACEGHGLGRQLWRKEEVQENVADDNSDHNQEASPPKDPVAKSLGDMVTAKQLGLIKGLAKELKLEADEECTRLLGCNVDELSKRAASDLIEHMSMLNRGDAPPMRRAPVPDNTPATTGPINQNNVKSGGDDWMDMPDAAASGPPASQKQKDYISNICSDRGENPELMALSLFKTEFPDITKQQASQMIEHLLKKGK